MAEEDMGTKQSGSSGSASASPTASCWSLLCFRSCTSPSSPAEKKPVLQKMLGKNSSESATTANKKHGGWKAMPYILGQFLFSNSTFSSP